MTSFRRKGVLAVYSRINRANRANGVRLKPGQLLIGPPRDVIGGAENTTILTWADPSLSYEGGVFFHYDRVDINRVFEAMWGKEADLVVDMAGMTKASQLVKTLERRYSLELDEEDIVDVDLDQTQAYSTIELKTSALSYIYKGSITLHLFNSRLSRARRTSDGQYRRTEKGIRQISQEG